MGRTLAPDWQSPYVNVFRLCGVDDLQDVEIKGDVVEHMVGGPGEAGASGCRGQLRTIFDPRSPLARRCMGRAGARRQWLGHRLTMPELWGGSEAPSAQGRQAHALSA